MIQSLFILNAGGEVIIEKHWRGNARREDTVTFWAALLGALRVPSDLPPFIPTAKGVLVHLHRSGLFFVASAHPDTLPLSVSDFLATLADTLHDYFGELNEHAIKDNFITVYEMLDEMLDNGFPLTLEPNILKQLVPPPTVMTRVIGTVTGDSTSGSAKLPFPTASPMTPWRRQGVKHAQNEIFVDICENVDLIYSSTSSPKLRHALVRGSIHVNCCLSGNPDITMSLKSVQKLDDTALHHCVRRDTFQESGQLSFVPPDGRFTLMDYVIRNKATFAPPVEIESSVRYDLASLNGTVSITMRPRFTIPPSPYVPNRGQPFSTAAISDRSIASQSSSSAPGSNVLAQVMNASARIGAPSLSGSSQSRTDGIMDDVEVVVPFGRGIASASLSANIGSVEFDSSSGTCRWIVGSIGRGVTPTLTGSVTIAGGQPSTGLVPPCVLAKFRIQGFSVSGMFVDRLELAPNEKYKYFKGLRCVTSAGRYEIRP
jgi:AP-3 complex subunit mu